MTIKKIYAAWSQSHGTLHRLSFYQYLNQWVNNYNVHNKQTIRLADIPLI